MFKFMTKSPSRKKRDSKITSTDGENKRNKPLSKHSSRYAINNNTGLKFNETTAKKNDADKDDVQTSVPSLISTSFVTSTQEPNQESITKPATKIDLKSSCKLTPPDYTGLVWSCGCTVSLGHVVHHKITSTKLLNSGKSDISSEEIMSATNLTYRNIVESSEDLCDLYGMHISDSPEFYSDSEDSSDCSQLSPPIISSLPPSTAVKVPATKVNATSGCIFVNGPLFLTVDDDNDGPTSFNLPNGVQNCTVINVKNNTSIMSNHNREDISVQRQCKNQQRDPTTYANYSIHNNVISINNACNIPSQYTDYDGETIGDRNTSNVKRAHNPTYSAYNSVKHHIKSTGDREFLGCNKTSNRKMNLSTKSKQSTLESDFDDNETLLTMTSQTDNYEEELSSSSSNSACSLVSSHSCVNTRGRNAEVEYNIERVKIINSSLTREATVAEILASMPHVEVEETHDVATDFHRQQQDIVSKSEMPSLSQTRGKEFDENHNRMSRSRERKLKYHYRSKSQNDASLSPRRIRRRSSILSSTEFRSFSFDGSKSSICSSTTSLTEVTRMKPDARFNSGRTTPRSRATSIDVEADLKILIKDVAIESTPSNDTTTSELSPTYSVASTATSVFKEIYIHDADEKENQVYTKSTSPTRYPCVSPRHIKSMKHQRNKTVNEVLSPDGITIVDNYVEPDTDNNNNSTTVYKYMSSSDIKKVACNRPLVSEKVYGATFPQSSSNKNNSEKKLNRSKSINVGDDENNKVKRTFSMLKTKQNLSAVINDNSVMQVQVNNHPSSNELTFAIISKPTGVTSHNGVPKHEINGTQSRRKRKTNANGTLKRTKDRPRKKDLTEANENNEDNITVKCRNPNCKEEVDLTQARARFKSCHHCFTYYCGKECRLQHWEKHKEKCVYGKISSICKRAMRVCRDDHTIAQALARVARTGYLSRGPGYTSIVFEQWEAAEDFITEKLLPSNSLPEYFTLGEIRTKLENDACSDEADELNAIYELCEKYYNPNKAYILRIKILVSKKMLQLHKRAYRHKDLNFVCLHVINPLPKQSSTNGLDTSSETLILTPPKAVNIADIDVRGSPNSSVTLHPDDLKKIRQLSFVNIQRKLRDKGIVLRHQFPDIYSKLCDYVEHDTHFTPSVIYPIDPKTGKSFMCLIMPGSEPQMLGWVKNPSILDGIETG